MNVQTEWPTRKSDHTCESGYGHSGKFDIWFDLIFHMDTRKEGILALTSITDYLNLCKWIKQKQQLNKSINNPCHTNTCLFIEFTLNHHHPLITIRLWISDVTWWQWFWFSHWFVARRYQGNTRTNAISLSIGPLGTHPNRIWIILHHIEFRNIYLY